MLGGYLGIAYITVETEGFYTYSFLNPEKTSMGKRAAYIVGILVAAVVVFLLSKGVIAARKWLTEKKLGMRGKLSAKDNSREQRVGDKA